METREKKKKVALFLEQTLITDVPLRVVRAAAALVPDHSAVAGRLLAGIEAAARHDRVSSLVHVDEARRLWAVDEAARRLCALASGVVIPILVIERDALRVAVPACCGHPGRGWVDSADLDPATGAISSRQRATGDPRGPVRWRRIAPPAAVDLTHDARCKEREES